MYKTVPEFIIDLAALRANYRLLKGQAKNATCSAVVKHDAYGLGVDVVVPVLQNEGCDTFWVAHAAEGQAVRKLAPKATIYVLQGFGDDTLDLFKQFKLTPVISTLAQFDIWAQHLSQVPFVLQVDTGLNRLGMRQDDLDALFKDDRFDRKKICLLMSHLACADECGHFMNQKQLDQFKSITALFPSVPTSLSASDGMFLGEEYQCDVIRCGAALYGINSTPYRENVMQSVLTVQAPVLQISDLKRGEYVGYGARFHASRDQRIAVLSIGYADGLLRDAAGKGVVWFDVDGQRYKAPIFGRVSMDMIVVDITDLPSGVPVGAMARLIDDVYTLDDMATPLGTIGYEVLSLFGRGQRFKRIVKD